MAEEKKAEERKAAEPAQKAEEKKPEKPAAAPAQKAAPAQAKPAAPAPLAKAAPRRVGGERVDTFRTFVQSIAARFPDLRRKLRQADMADEPSDFIVKILQGSVALTLVLAIVYFLLATAMGWPVWLLALTPLVLVFMFFYLMRIPDIRMAKRAREVDKDLIFAGRHMLIELRGGLPLYNTMVNVSKDYGEVSKEFTKILEKIVLGVPADIAMHEVAENNPSQAFRRIIMQLVNSLRSGSDVSAALATVLDQLSREQIIELKAYGQKLNPLAMFYMIFGIILPSLGIALSVVLLSFLSINLTSTMLIWVAVLLALIQFVFLTMVDSSRPKFTV